MSDAASASAPDEPVSAASSAIAGEGRGTAASEPLAVSIVPMRRRHVRSVLHIESQVYPRPWSMSLFLSELALRTSRAYAVARVGHDVVGYGGLMMSIDDGHITTLAVDPRVHRYQIGSRLLLVLTREALARGAVALTLEVRISNRPAQNLYRRFGFEAVGVRKGYYAENREDAVVMWARDVGRPEYARRLAAIEAGIRGSTEVEAWPPW